MKGSFGLYYQFTVMPYARLSTDTVSRLLPNDRSCVLRHSGQVRCVLALVGVGSSGAVVAAKMACFCVISQCPRHASSSSSNPLTSDPSRLRGHLRRSGRQPTHRQTEPILAKYFSPTHGRSQSGRHVNQAKQRARQLNRSKPSGLELLSPQRRTLATPRKQMNELTPSHSGPSQSRGLATSYAFSAAPANAGNLVAMDRKR